MAGTLRIDGLETTVPEGATLFDCAERLGVRVPTSCQKQGKCRECLVEVTSGADLLSPRTAEEGHLPTPFRLSCRTHLELPGRVECQTMRRGVLRIEADSRLPDELPHPPLDPRWRRERGQLLLDGRPVGPIDGPPLGLAVDLGTTTVVLRLWDLEGGEPLATHSFENPQRFGGSDVMARIRYDGDHPGRLLRRVLLGYLRRAVEALPCDPGAIVEMAVAANTTMRDLFFGLDVQPIGQLPYRSSTENELRRGARRSTHLETPARRLGLPLHPRALVYGLPLISGHVGGDAAACLLATGLADSDRVTMVMDLGTNTELLLGRRDRILATSCPAGPAFEGGGVLCGVPALEGAIERVSVAADGEVATRVIGGGSPIGLCGSGLVDLLSELARHGQMNGQGRFTGEDGEFTVDAARRIFLTEPDINELAQAKGANAAGVRLLADRFGVKLDEIDRFYLAGGFARHLDLEAAAAIGLIPDLPADRVFQIGNAALEGAAWVLRSASSRRRLEELVNRVEHVALESDARFFDYFVDGCQFAPFPTRPGVLRFPR